MIRSGDFFDFHFDRDNNSMRKGKIIVASMEGDVTLVSSEGDYGNHIKITNGEVTTLYAHCSKIYVKEGEHIVQGQQIAEVGATGNVTGPHLHFEVRQYPGLYNNRVAPLDYIPR